MARKIPVDTQQLKAVILYQVDVMRNEEKHCDFLIKVGPEEIPVHRNIVCATSDYFDAMFSHPTRENQSGVVEMIGVDPECAIICVDHMYGKEVSILPEKYEPMMYAANLMQLNTLCDAIATFLEANLDPKSFFTVRRIANMYGCKELGEKCNKYLEENLRTIAKEKDFSEQDLCVIRKIIGSKSRIPEGEKLEALLTWIEYESERTKFLKEMMQCVDLSTVSVEFRRFVAESNSLIRDNLELYRLFCISMLDSLDVFPCDIPGVEMNDATVVFDKSTRHLECFIPRENIWKQMQEINPGMRCGFLLAVTLGYHIYVLSWNQSVHRLEYSSEKATWERLADMTMNHGYCPPVAALSGYIFAVGGHHDSSTKSAVKYNPIRNTWSKLRDKRSNSQFSELIPLKGYSLGGKVEGTWLKNVERFDPNTSMWMEVAPMNEPKGVIGVTTMDYDGYENICLRWFQN